MNSQDVTAEPDQVDWTEKGRFERYLALQNKGIINMFLSHTGSVYANMTVRQYEEIQTNYKALADKYPELYRRYRGHVH